MPRRSPRCRPRERDRSTLPPIVRSPATYLSLADGGARVDPGAPDARTFDVMRALTGWVLAHGRVVVLAWAVLTVAGGFAASQISGELTQSFASPGREGFDANAEIAERFGAGGAVPPIVLVGGDEQAPRARGEGGARRAAGDRRRRRGRGARGRAARPRRGGREPGRARGGAQGRGAGAGRRDGRDRAGRGLVRRRGTRPADRDAARRRRRAGGAGVRVRLVPRARARCWWPPSRSSRRSWCCSGWRSSPTSRSSCSSSSA